MGDPSVDPPKSTFLPVTELHHADLLCIVLNHIRPLNPMLRNGPMEYVSNCLRLALSSIAPSFLIYSLEAVTPHTCGKGECAEAVLAAYLSTLQKLRFDYTCQFLMLVLACQAHGREYKWADFP